MRIANGNKYLPYIILVLKRIKIFRKWRPCYVCVQQWKLIAKTSECGKWLVQKKSHMTFDCDSSMQPWKKTFICVCVDSHSMYCDIGLCYISVSRACIMSGLSEPVFLNKIMVCRYDGADVKSYLQQQSYSVRLSVFIWMQINRIYKNTFGISNK